MLKERENGQLKNARHLPGIQGPNHASLLSNNILKHELSSHPEASLLFQPNGKKQPNQLFINNTNTSVHYLNDLKVHTAYYQNNNEIKRKNLPKCTTTYLNNLGMIDLICHWIRERQISYQCSEDEHIQSWLHISLLFGNNQ